MLHKKNVLIVTGVARSGTTALAELLNSHEQLCLGVERFKFQYLIKNNYSSSLFEKERFFDFREEDTNLRPAVRPHWQGTYETMAEKWDTARIIGDKVPDMTPILGDFIRANPTYKYIYILRNIKDVALSWQARAQRVSDSWPVGKDFARACESWGEQYTALLDYLKTHKMRDRMLLLDYDRMFLEHKLTERALLNFLGLSASESMSRVFDEHVAFATTKTLRKLSPEHAEIYNVVDLTAFRTLRKISTKQINHFSSLDAL